MAKTKNKIIIETVKEQIFWAYSNLAMAHSAVEKQQIKYNSINFMIRSRLFKGLVNGTMNIGTFFDDERIKLHTGQICNYCGSGENLSLDHILPQKLGGCDDAENLIFACKSCNSSKGKKDLIEWMNSRERFLPLMVIRRYLKLIYNYCNMNNLLEYKIETLCDLHLPFKIELLPIEYPNPDELILNITELKK